MGTYYRLRYMPDMIDRPTPNDLQRLRNTSYDEATNHEHRLNAIFMTQSVEEFGETPESVMNAVQRLVSQSHTEPYTAGNLLSVTPFERYLFNQRLMLDYRPYAMLYNEHFARDGTVTETSHLYRMVHPVPENGILKTVHGVSNTIMEQTLDRYSDMFTRYADRSRAQIPITVTDTDTGNQESDL